MYAFMAPHKISLKCQSLQMESIVGAIETRPHYIGWTFMNNTFSITRSYDRTHDRLRVHTAHVTHLIVWRREAQFDKTGNNKSMEETFSYRINLLLESQLEKYEEVLKVLYKIEKILQ